MFNEFVRELALTQLHPSVNERVSQRGTMLMHRTVPAVRTTDTARASAAAQRSPDHENSRKFAKFREILEEFAPNQAGVVINSKCTD